MDSVAFRHFRLADPVPTCGCEAGRARIFWRLADRLAVGGADRSESLCWNLFARILGSPGIRSISGANSRSNTSAMAASVSRSALLGSSIGLTSNSTARLASKGKVARGHHWSSSCDRADQSAPQPTRLTMSAGRMGSFQRALGIAPDPTQKY